MAVPCIWFEIIVNYQLDANVYFSSTCFGPIRPSSGTIEFIISFTNAAYGVLGAFVKEIINSIAPEDGRVGPKHVELK